MAAYDHWYPAAPSYWHDQPEKFPYRHGDVFATPELDELRSKNKLWRAVAVIYPSCELGAKAQDDTHVVVARIIPVADHSKKHRPAIRTGWAEVDGDVRVAHANTFWLPPFPDEPATGGPDHYIDFRRTQRVHLGQLRNSGRRAAMSHDARIALIRREIYFRFRWLVSYEQVQQLEAARIGGDPNFVGPRPDWAE